MGKNLRSIAEPDLITTALAARRLGVSLTMVRQLIHSGEIRGHKIGRAIRVDPVSLEEYLERSRIGSSR